MTDLFARLSDFERPRSTSAIWCQRLAVFAVPFLLITILGHRFGAIDTYSTFWLLGLTVLILLGALIAGVHGFYALWTYGHAGGIKSARGMALAALLLCPFLYQAVQAFNLPQLYDVSTDLEDLPAFDSVLAERSDSMNEIVDPSEVEKQLQLRSYPRVAARRYPLDTVRVFKEVVEIIGENDWTILAANTEQGKATIDDEGSGLVARPVTDASGRPLRIPIPQWRPATGDQSTSTSLPSFEAVEVSPIGRQSTSETDEQDERYIEAVATSFLFGFESDVVIRLIEEEEGTLVDMRSNSRWGPHDLGSNADRIIDFLSDLDAGLQGVSQ